MKIILSMLFAMLLFPLHALQETTQPDPVVLRALLIGSDSFITQENTYPIAKNNLNNLQELLSQDARHYQDIRILYEEINHPDKLAQAVNECFADADGNDISLFYFSTHGIMDPDVTGLYLSDGQEENLLHPEQLSVILTNIPGQKILLLDACNSGAFIGKGIETLSPRHPFTAPGIHVITSAGGCEASWQWQSSGSNTAGGTSYFSALLMNGLGGYHAADTNKDNTVTINEAYAFLLENCASSTPHRYPEDAQDAPLFLYHPEDSHALPPVSALTFEDTLLSSDQTDVDFSFTVHRDTRLFYQLVYYKDGKWDFENAAIFQDTQESGGVLKPGRKQRKIHLDTQDRSDSGYVILHLFSQENETPVFLGGRLLCVQPSAGEVALAVNTGPAFDPSADEELPILISHDMPCALSVTVRNASGKTVRRLSYAQPTRPLQLPSSGTTCYWNGLDSRNQPAPAGKYYIQVQATVGEARFTAESEYFNLLSPVEIPPAPIEQTK